MPRPRNEKIITYEKDDLGVLTFPRKDIEAEIPAEIGGTGMCYTSSVYAGRKGVFLVFREEEN
jgi:hypothetical protein